MLYCVYCFTFNTLLLVSFVVKISVISRAINTSHLQYLAIYFLRHVWFYKQYDCYLGPHAPLGVIRNKMIATKIYPYITTKPIPATNFVFVFNMNTSKLFPVLFCKDFILNFHSQSFAKMNSKKLDIQQQFFVFNVHCRNILSVHSSSWVYHKCSSLICTWKYIAILIASTGQSTFENKSEVDKN